MRSKGRISSWNDAKGFGFISPQAGGQRVFIHINEFGNRDRRPQLNDVVTYALSKDKRGRTCAVSASIAGIQNKKKPVRQGKAPSILFVLFFLSAVAISAAASHLPIVIIITYAVLSLVTFAAYAIDKSAARRGAWRTNEGTLHVLGLIGGWPGALIAQQTLRHKSKKASFRAVFWFTVLVNCSTLVWLHTDSGRTFLEAAIGNFVSNNIPPYQRHEWHRAVNRLDTLPKRGRGSTPSRSESVEAPDTRIFSIQPDVSTGFLIRPNALL